jgi:hypothetical protein
MVVTLTIDDDMVAKVWGDLYKTSLKLNQSLIFIDWLASITGFQVQIEFDAPTTNWVITFPSNEEMVQFKLQWL